MSHRHIHNSSNGLVRKSLSGGVALNPTFHSKLSCTHHARSTNILYTYTATKVEYAATSSSSTRITVFSGEGADSEPVHADYACHEMLTSFLLW
ncbi:hypothetical protein BDR04DRAFT_1109428 [Suillus decipiens]|nr:hypothetical protein BDR04DRAFT_1109428 [Suillus decipiens]